MLRIKTGRNWFRNRAVNELNRLSIYYVTEANTAESLKQIRQNMGVEGNW